MHLYLDHTPVSDISPVARCTNLRLLLLDDTQVTDLTPLANLKNLTELHIQGTPVSEEQVKLLQKALPNCKIESDFATTTGASVAADVESPKGDLSPRHFQPGRSGLRQSPRTTDRGHSGKPQQRRSLQHLRAIAWKYKGEFDNMIQDSTKPSASIPGSPRRTTTEVVLAAGKGIRQGN